MLPDSHATILAPPADGIGDRLSAPAFGSLPIERHGGGAAFLASFVIHALVALSLPAALRSLPPNPDAAFQARLRPSLHAALILRMPNRIYLPVPSVLPPGAPPAGGKRKPGESPRTRRGPSGTSSRATRPQSPLRFRTILIQPGKPIADDPRTSRLPSLLFLSRSTPPAPQGPVDPGAHTRGEPELKTGIATAGGPATPEPLHVPPLVPVVAESMPKVSLPVPNARSLVAHGEGTEAGANSAQPATGADVAVLSVSSSAPQARQLVEIPPVNQPAAVVSLRPRDSLSESRGDGKSATPGDDSSGPPRPAKHNSQPAGSSNARRQTAAREKPVHAGAQSKGKRLESQSQSVARAAALSLVRTIRTASGMIEVLDLPNGTQQLRYLPKGSFDVVVVESSPGATIPNAEQLLTGRPVQTVFLTLRAGRDWILQYCLPGGGSNSGQAGMVVTLGRQPKVEAPFIQQALLPAENAVRPTRPALFQGALAASGRFARLRPVLDAAYQPLPELLPYLEQWQFRPAKVDGAPAEVEVLLLVQPFAHQ